MFQKDNYEILRCSKPYSSDENVVQYIQGAEVKVVDFDLRSRIHWVNNEVEGKVEKVSFLVENNNLKLGDIFFSSPWGIIKKNRTGVGATTLELNSDRDSIIVVPTRALAYDKALSSRDENGHWKFLYVGSKIPEAINDMPSIREYLSDPTIIYKKILVVADSLHKVLREIGTNVYNSYFLMVDEIDTYQSDSTYRSTLEDVLDYYLKFNEFNRCLVSATINEFSNPDIQKESVIDIAYSEPLIRTIDLIHTNNPHAVAIEKIQNVFFNSDDKILIAYNKITNIKQIIEALSPECKENCAVLCSSSSKRKVAEYYYNGLNDNLLPKRITFITCTYFVGIDINERFNLISISNIDNAYTVLSTEKLMQIAGRCRDKDGLISELVIYNTEEYNKPYSPEYYKSMVIDLAEDVKMLAVQVDVINTKYPNLIGGDFYNVKNDIVEKAKFLLSSNNEIFLLRKSIDENITLAYFNIDAIYEFYKLKSNLYSIPEQLLNELINQGNTVNSSIQNMVFTQEQIEINKRVIDELKEIEHNELENLVTEIREIYEMNDPSDDDLRRLTWDKYTSQVSKVFIDRFIELKKYIELDQLLEKLKEVSTSNSKEYRGLYNSAIFWALAENHPFKQSVYEAFRPRVRYLRQEVVSKIGNILSYHISLRVTDNVAIQIANQFCNLTRGNNSGTTYTVKSQNSYNPKEFTGQPVRLISSEIPLNRKLKFGRS